MLSLQEAIKVEYRSKRMDMVKVASYKISHKSVPRHVKRPLFSGVVKVLLQ